MTTLLVSVGVLVDELSVRPMGFLTDHALIDYAFWGAADW